jgi:hypothetical protein
MTAPGPVRTWPQLLARVRDMLFRPERTWDAVEAEPSSPGEIYRGHVMPLAALKAVCTLLGVLVFHGFQVASVRIHQSAVGSALEAVVGFILTLALVFVVALIVEVLSPLFGGIRNRTQALKLVAYSGTPFWVAGVLALYPSLALPAAVVGGLYSLYALNVGLPKLMKVDEDRSLVCFALILAAVIMAVAVKDFVTHAAAELGGPLGAS